MTAPPKFLIVTADDFGLHPAINAAVEQAHALGVLTAASLMVGGAAATDAIARAKRLPKLRVGLHLTLSDGLAVLPPLEIAALVDAQGRFGQHPARVGLHYFCSPRARRQLRAEIAAQFRAFHASGLVLDRVDCHQHLLLHPTLLQLTLEVGRDHGLRRMRLPAEPGSSLLLRPWLWQMRRQLRRAGVACNDRIYGLSRSGGMDEAALLSVLKTLPSGVSEIYAHPATASVGTPGYRPTDELAALLSPRVRAALAASGASCGGYADALG